MTRFQNTCETLFFPPQHRVVHAPTRASLHEINSSIQANLNLGYGVRSESLRHNHGVGSHYIHNIEWNRAICNYLSTVFGLTSDNKSPGELITNQEPLAVAPQQPRLILA